MESVWVSDSIFDRILPSPRACTHGEEFLRLLSIDRVGGRDPEVDSEQERDIGLDPARDTSWDAGRDSVRDVGPEIGLDKRWEDGTDLGILFTSGLEVGRDTIPEDSDFD